MPVYTCTYKNHSSNPGYVRWDCGHWPKSRLTMFSAPLGILETQGLSWVQVQSSSSPYYTAHPAPAAGWVRQDRFSLPQSPNTHSRHTLHFSRNPECPSLNVLNSITKATLLSWFCITTANRSSQECSKCQIDINAPEGLKPSSVIQNCAMLLCPSQKYPPSALSTCKTRVRLRVSSRLLSDQLNCHQYQLQGSEREAAPLFSLSFAELQMITGPWQDIEGGKAQHAEKQVRRHHKWL